MQSTGMFIGKSQYLQALFVHLLNITIHTCCIFPERSKRAYKVNIQEHQQALCKSYTL